MKKGLVSLFTLTLIGSVAVYATNSYFSDQETSSGNTFQAGALDLKVNSTDNPGVLVNILDLKPGDNYDIEKKIKVIDNPAFVWVMLTDLVATQDAQFEPEIKEENGTPKSDLHNYLLYDLMGPHGMIINLSDQVSVASASGCWVPLGVLPGNQEVTLTQSFHLPPSVTNWAQGDMLTFTENFYAVQERNNPQAIPPPASYIWNGQTKSCIPANNPTPSPTPAPLTPPFVVSDSSWKVSQTLDDNWFQPGFDDSNWPNSVAPSYGTCNFNPINVYISEHGAIPMWSPNPVEWGTAYFRKHVYLPDNYFGKIRAVLDDTGEIFVNGTLVLTDNLNSGNELVSGDVSAFLHTGDNVIAMRVSDTAGICQDVQFELEIKPNIIVFAQDRPASFVTDFIDIPQGYTSMTFHVTTTGTLLNWSPIANVNSFINEQVRVLCNNNVCPDVTIPVISWFYQFATGTSAGNITATATLNREPGSSTQTLGYGVNLPFTSGPIQTNPGSNITIAVGQRNPQNMNRISLQRNESNVFVEKEHIDCDGGAVCPLIPLPLLGGEYKVFVDGTGTGALISVLILP